MSEGSCDSAYWNSARGFNKNTKSFCEQKAGYWQVGSEEKNPAKPATQAKKAPKARFNRSPLQSTRLSKQMTTRSANQARKRLCVERETTDNLPGSRAQNPPAMVQVPAIRKRRADFRNPQNPIP